MVTITAIGPAADGFMVKDWTFQNPPPNYFNERPRSGSLVGPRNVTDDPGIPGQSNADPPSNFNNHFIVGYGGQLWDPSYGGEPFANGREYEDGPNSPIKALRKRSNGLRGLNQYDIAPNTGAVELNFR